MSKSLEKIKHSDKLTSVGKLDQEIRRTLRSGSNTANKKKLLPKAESQGPIDWSHHGIKSKHRGEAEREEAWHHWKQTISISKTIMQDYQKILPVVKVERHPILALYYRLLEEENVNSVNRTRSRLLMKKFIYDVQELWLANLQHLHEHEPANIYAEHQEDGDDGGSAGGGGVDDDFNRGVGLAHRRDVKAIAGLNHQIQSVSQRRVFNNAYHTSRLPPIRVVLDYKPLPPPVLPEARLMLPQRQLLLHGLAFLPSSQGGFAHVWQGFPLLSKGCYMLQVDRLVPSLDLVNSKVVADILWRFSLIDCQSLKQRICLVSETHIAQYVTKLITSAPNPPSSAIAGGGRTYRSEQFVPLPFKDQSVEWEGQIEVTLSSAATIVQPRIDGLCTINIAIKAYLRPFGPQQSKSETRAPLTLSCSCSPLEIYHLLSLPSTTPLFDLDYWQHEDRLVSCWIPLCNYLELEGQTADMKEIRRMPLSISLRMTNDQPQEKFWNALEGALTTLQALSCVYEMMPSFQLIGTDERADKEDDEEDDEGSEEKSVPKIAFASPFDALLSLRLEFEDVNDYLLESVSALPTRPDDVVTLKQVIKELIRTGQWEELQRRCYLNLSMHAGQLYPRATLVPGAQPFGTRRGLAWLSDANDASNEGTQPAVSFFRDANRSTNDTILVNGILAIDTAVTYPLLTAWEPFNQKPAPYPNEEANGVISMTTTPALRILQEALQSPIENRPSQRIIIFTASAVEGVDYVDRYQVNVPIGCRRYVPVRNEYGFREQIEVRLLDVDGFVATRIFGITREGAVPNNTYSNPRNIWHNSIAITEHINRPRLPKDYHYIVANPEHCGANEATSYTTRMKAHELVGVTSSAFPLYEDAYQKIMQLRDVFGKQLALDGRIERLEEEVRIKEIQRKNQIQRELQLALEKRLKKITKSEQGWRRRLAGSKLVELQGNWERRQDLRSGMVFFHQITNIPIGQEEKCCETCQWEVPAVWDGSALWTSNDPLLLQQGSLAPSGRSTSASLPTAQNMMEESIKGVQEKLHGAFSEPTTGWAPYQTAPTMMMTSHNNGNGGSITGNVSLLQSQGGGLQSTTLPLFNANNYNNNNSAGQRHSHDDQSVLSDVDSVGADRSLAESRAATIDTANLEHIAEQLLSSDELMRVLAKRLGLKESQIVPADELSSVFTINSMKNQDPTGKTLNGINGINERLPAPRDPYATDLYEPEFDSDDELWSDDEHEVGDFDAGKEIASDDMLPQDQLQAANLRRREEKATFGSDLGNVLQAKRKSSSSEDKSVPSNIPFLDFTDIKEKSDKREEMANERYGWRRLPRPVFKEGFLASALRTQTKGPDLGSVNTLNAPVFLLPISPVDACKYTPENMAVPIETIFISNAKRDAERAVATLQRNIKREQDLARAFNADDLILGDEAKEFTSVEQFLNQQYRTQKQALNPMDAAIERAILAAKSNNIADMEDALAEEVPVNSADEFGNTLFILAAQQGAKRMCKFLLRRGANINMQNHSGNTALHYCYAYSHHALGDYLKAKGADDSILNVDGLTCYEGLNREEMNNNFADHEESDYIQDEDNESLAGQELNMSEASGQFDESGSLASASNAYSQAYDSYVNNAR
eukprot:gene9908-10956_t